MPRDGLQEEASEEGVKADASDDEDRAAEVVPGKQQVDYLKERSTECRKAKISRFLETSHLRHAHHADRTSGHRESNGLCPPLDEVRVNRDHPRSYG